jgi:hypothetical protein
MSEDIKYLPETGHWKELFSNKNAHIGAHNINEGEELTLTINWVGKGKAVDKQSGADISVPMIKFNEAPPMILNITNGNIIESLHGAMRAGWIGKRIILYKAKGKSFGGYSDLVKVKQTKPPEVDGVAIWSEKIRACKTMDDLIKTFTDTPNNLKKSVEAIKNEMKTKLGQG